MINAPPSTASRFVGLDISKHHLVIAAVDQAQQLVLQPKKVTLANFESWASQNLKTTDVVVLEATSNA